MEENSMNGLEKLEKMEETNKKLLYEARKKNGLIASLLNIAIPGAGYVYCHNYMLGIIAFCIAFFLGIIAFLSAGVGLIFVFMFWVVMLIDGGLAAIRTNRKLAKEIFN